MLKVPISTVLLTKNSAQFLPKYFAKADWIDDIVVLDAGSTDGTLEILAQYPQCQIHPQPKEFLDENGFITDFGAIRNYGYTLAKHKWIICIDSDEQFSDNFVDEMSAIVQKNVPGVYSVIVTECIAGVPIFTLFPIRQVRLFHRDVVVGCVKKIHERIQPLPNVSVQNLSVEIFAEMHTDQIERNKKYAAKELLHMRKLTYFEWFRWIFLYNLRSIVIYGIRTILNYCVPKRGKRRPIRYFLYYLHYNFLIAYTTFPLVRKVSEN